MPASGVAGPRLRGDAETRSGLLAAFLVVFVFFVVFLFLVFVLIVLVVVQIGLGEFEHGQWQRLAKEVAFIAIHTHTTLPSLTSTTQSGWPPDFSMTTLPGFKSMICSSDYTTQIAI